MGDEIMLFESLKNVRAGKMTRQVKNTNKGILVKGNVSQIWTEVKFF